MPKNQITSCSHCHFYSLIDPPFSSGLLLTQMNGLDGCILALFQFVKCRNEPARVITIGACVQDGSDAPAARLGNSVQIVHGKGNRVFRMAGDSNAFSHANKTLFNRVNSRWCWLLVMCHFQKKQFFNKRYLILRLGLRRDEQTSSDVSGNRADLRQSP